MKELYKLLKNSSLKGGASLFGVAEIEDLKKDFLIENSALAPMKRAVVLGVKLLDAVLDELTNHPTQLYFSHYRQVNYLLDRLALELAYRIESLGGKALPVAASQTLDWEKQRGHLSHKLLAQKAGLGWLGRNNLLVNPELGARIRLVTILTSLELPAGQEISAGCEECLACIPLCPAGAVKETPQEFDHLACFNRLKEFKNQGLAGQYICGICLKACQGKRQ